MVGSNFITILRLIHILNIILTEIIFSTISASFIFPREMRRFYTCSLPSCAKNPPLHMFLLLDIGTVSFYDLPYPHAKAPDAKIFTQILIANEMTRVHRLFY